MWREDISRWILLIWKDEIKPTDASRIVRMIDVKEFITNAVVFVVFSGVGVIGVGFIKYHTNA